MFLEPRLIAVSAISPISRPGIIYQAVHLVSPGFFKFIYKMPVAGPSFFSCEERHRPYRPSWCYCIMFEFATKERAESCQKSSRLLGFLEISDHYDFFVVRGKFLDLLSYDG